MQKMLIVVAFAACFVTPAWADDCGGTITAGGTAQNALSVNPNRGHVLIENPASATEDLYISVTTAATVGGAGNYADLLPGGSALIERIGNAISVIAATTSHRYMCTEWQ